MMFLNAAVAICSFSLLGVPLALAHEGEEHPAASASTSLPIVAGEIQKVDEASGKMTIKHGAIINLNMEAMTMVFKASDPAMLKVVKIGDKIMFTANKVNGQLTVLSIKKAK
jgi:Cu/Ag efflux protein CusF